MKLFCSYAFTGEDLDLVSTRMRLVVDTLNASEHNAYCPLFDLRKIKLQEKGDVRAIFEYAFEKLKRNDGLVAIVASDRKSEGQLMEIGATLADKKPVYLFVHESAMTAPSHLSKLATRTFSWKTEEELQAALRKI